MKDSSKVVITFAILLIIGGFPLVWQFLEITGTMAYYFLFMILKMIPHLPTSILDVIENIVCNNWTLTNVIWLDSLLIHIASFLPSSIIFILGTLGLKIDPKISGLLSLIVFLFILQLFSSILFWMIMGIMILIMVLISVNSVIFRLGIKYLFK